jgi:ATP-dependent RNA helicase DDX10/DBP4
LVVDEFDLLLEMGFVKSTIAINSALPTEKQTMLFSATSSSQVSSLVTQIVNANNCILVNCLSSGASSVQKLVALKDIEKVPVSASLPAALKHHVTFCDLQSKFTVLYQFLRKHANSKVLVFFGTCKEVRFGYESFCKLRPGTPIMEIHGKQKQLSRTKTYYKFCDLKTGALFTTDVCSRGLDFPHIDYVVHIDCPDSFEIYVHRVGRTARYKAEGSSILFLCEFERSFLDGLNANNIEWATMKLHSNNSLTSQLEKICSKHPEIKHLAEKAFISYLRSIFILHGKNQSLLSDINMTEYASSLGLANVPYINGSRQ